jgi:hypothetical protein
MAAPANSVRRDNPDFLLLTDIPASSPMVWRFPCGREIARMMGQFTRWNKAVTPR